jgi:hypothetical protein
MELPNDFALGCFRALDLFQDGGPLGFPAIGSWTKVMIRPSPSASFCPMKYLGDTGRAVLS